MMPATSTARWLDPLVEGWIGLPGAETLARPDQLEELVGRTIDPVRVRVKPGLSMVVGWQDRTNRTGPGRGLAGYGWAAVLTDPEKIAAVRRRARHVGVGLLADQPVGRVELGGAEAVLLAGLMDSDPGFARELAHARRRVPATAGLHVLAYNPGKRVVAAVEVGPARRVLRVAAGRQDRLVSAANRWRAFGAPVLPVRTLGRRGSAVESPWWGRGDLTRVGGADQARLAGRALAETHRASAQSGADSALSPVEVDDLVAVLPGERMRIQAIVTEVTRRIESVVRGRVGLVHGDMSPDQVLVDDEGQIRIVDLDRGTQGPAGVDAGSWLAACDLTGRDDLAEAFLAGWDQPLPAEELAAWRARAVLAAAVEPFRTLRPDWREQVTARIARAEALLSQGER